MQNAETKRLLFEWLYGVQLYLESGSIKSKMASWPDVERKTHALLLEWAIPVQVDMAEKISTELHVWKNRHHAEAWNVFLTGRFLREDTWDQQLWENQFNDLREMARAARPEIWNLIQPEEEDPDSGRLTPVIPVSDEDLERCLPSQRITLRCQDDPEAMARVQHYLAMITIGDEVNTEDASQERISLTMLQPPTLHPTNPQMRAVQVSESDDVTVGSSESFEICGKQDTDENPLITIAAEKDE